ISVQDLSSWHDRRTVDNAHGRSGYLSFQQFDRATDRAESPRVRDGRCRHPKCPPIGQFYRFSLRAVNSTYWNAGTRVWDDSRKSQYIQYRDGGCANDAFIPYLGPEQLQEVASLIKAN